MCPGRYKKGHTRDLITDLQTLKNKYKVQVLVSLVEPHELVEMKMQNFFNEVKNLFESYHFPIRDKWLPDREGICKCVTFILGQLQQGKNVVIHCNGGKGRSGTVLSGVLIAMGHDANRVIEIVRECRNGTLTNTNGTN
jgi:protein-tyrosine phosphatase